MSTVYDSKQELCQKMWLENKDELISMCKFKMQSCPNEIEDVISDAFFYLCKAILSDITLDNPKSWLFSVTSNLIKKKYSEMNKNKKQRVSLNEDNLEIYGDPVFSEEILIDSLISDALIENLRMKIVDSLCESEQQLYKYIYEEKLKMKIIAEKMNMTEAAVKQRHYRLNKKIGNMVKGRLESLWEEMQ